MASREVYTDAPHGRTRRWFKFLELSVRYSHFGFRTFPLIHKRQPAVAWMRIVAQLSMFTDRTPSLIFDVSSSKVNGLAVITGPISNRLCVRDFDSAEAYHAWRAAFPLVAARCFVVQTRRGFHVYFRLPVGHPPIYRQCGDGELLGDGKHYVPLPGSLHSDRVYYRWLDGREPVKVEDLPELDPVAVGLCPPSSESSKGLEGSEFDTDESLRGGTGPSIPVSVEEKDTPPNTNTMSLCAADETVELQLEPLGMGERNRCLFNMARVFKADPALADLPFPPDGVMAMVKDWHARYPLPVCHRHEGLRDD